MEILHLSRHQTKLEWNSSRDIKYQNYRDLYSDEMKHRSYKDGEGLKLLK